MDGPGRNFLGRFLGGKASASSFSVTIASQKRDTYARRKKVSVFFTVNRKSGRGRRPRPGRRARAPASFVYALLSKNAVNRGFYVLVSLRSVAKS